MTADIYLPDSDMDTVTVTESGCTVFENNGYLAGQIGILSGEKQGGYFVFQALNGECN